MKSIIKFSIMVLLVVVTFTSCYDEYLDPVPKTSISDLSSFDTRSRILGQVNGLYAFYRNGQYLGGRYLVYNEIRGDEYLNLGNNGVTGLQTWALNVAPSTNEVQNLWVQVYAAINAVNVFLEGLEANKSKAMDANELTEEEYSNYRGEALALRGMAYFHLLQLYARPYKQDPNGLGMVLRLTGSRSSADNSKARSSVQETYDQIIIDLNEAETLLPTVTAGTANAAAYTSRIHKNTVIALKSRVYLHLEDWASVLTEGNKIVPTSAPFVSPVGVAHQLNVDYTAVFNPPYTSNESIFSMPMSATELPGTQNQLGYYFSAPPAGNVEYPINETSLIWTNPIFAASDARKTFTTASGGRLYLGKFSRTPHTDWVPVIRYAEVLLNVAEAEVMANGVNARAVDLLNAVYLRSNPTVTAYVVGDFANANAFVTRLMAERNLEFMGEGIRNMDITRKLADFPAKATVNACAYTSSQYVWPIPQNEINTNQAIVQNP